jgi:hypothetical protein
MAELPDITITIPAHNRLLRAGDEPQEDETREALQSFAMGLTGEEFAILLMAILPDPDNRTSGLRGYDFWFDVARGLGPDWLHGLKRVSLFMNAVSRGEF